MNEPVVRGDAAEDLLDLGIDELLDMLGHEDPGPGSGSVAALVVAMAAALTCKAARRSRDRWAEAGGAAAQAHALRLRAAPLAITNAKVYAEALALLDDPAAEDRNRRLGLALERAAEVPLQIAGTAADVAALARDVAAECAPEVRAEAVGAAVLAKAAAETCAHLVAINLGITPDDDRVEAARLLAHIAATEAGTALSE